MIAMKLKNRGTVLFTIITLLITAAVTWAASSGSVNSSQHYTEDTTITATSDDVEGDGKLYSIGSKAPEDITITVDPGKKLTVNSTASSGRAYAVNNIGTGTITIIGDAVYNAEGSGNADARAIRNNGDGAIIIDGNTQINSIVTSTSEPVGIDSWGNGSITLNGAKTEININGSEASGKWSNSVRTGASGDVYFNAKDTVLNTNSIGYTAQGMSVNTPDNLVEFNSENTTIVSSSDYGATGIGASGEIKFNKGNITIHSIIPNGIGKSNAVGILGCTTTVAKAVNSFNIVIEGSGCDNGNPGYANGTAGCNLSEEESLTVNNPKFDIKVTGGGSSEREPGANYSDSYGIRTNYGGNIKTSENTAVNINVADHAQAAVGVLSDNGSYSDNGKHITPYLTDSVNMLGDVLVTVSGTKAGTLEESASKIFGSKSLAVGAIYGGKVVLGSKGKAVILSGDVAAADTASISITGEEVIISGESLKADNSSIDITAGPGSQILAGVVSADNSGKITLTLNGDWTGKGTCVVFKSNTSGADKNITINSAEVKGVVSAGWNEDHTEFTLVCETKNPIKPVTPVIPDGAKEEITPVEAETSTVAENASEREKAAKITEVAATMPNVPATELDIDATGTVVLESDTAKKAAENVISTDETLKSVLPLPIFKATLEKDKIAAAAFTVTGEQLGVTVPENVRIMKYLGSGAADSFEYAAVPADFDDKSFTIFKHGTNEIAKTIEKGTSYDLTVFIKDGGDFDLDKIAGQVTDPTMIVTAEKSPSPKPGGSSSGCNGGFGSLALAAFAIVTFAYRRKG
ncbi:MAG: SYNERG-CTERM sorting domain-containing protein [Cloacibacillus porcorum]|nr:SYNERG-CTERM sorting domain-containing protein [Cloacibacillus porcorum]